MLDCFFVLRGFRDILVFSWVLLAVIEHPLCLIAVFSVGVIASCHRMSIAMAGESRLLPLAFRVSHEWHHACSIQVFWQLDACQFT